MISAWEHGRHAAQHGKHIQACPFDTDNPEWRDGAMGSATNRSCRDLGPRLAHA
jgi:hypothetical protein